MGVQTQQDMNIVYDSEENGGAGGGMVTVTQRRVNGIVLPTPVVVKVPIDVWITVGCTMQLKQIEERQKKLAAGHGVMNPRPAAGVGPR